MCCSDSVSVKWTQFWSAEVSLSLYSTVSMRSSILLTMQTAFPRVFPRNDPGRLSEKPVKVNVPGMGACSGVTAKKSNQIIQCVVPCYFSWSLSTHEAVKTIARQPKTHSGSCEARRWPYPASRWLQSSLPPRLGKGHTGIWAAQTATVWRRCGAKRDKLERCAKVGLNQSSVSCNART